MQEMVIFLKMQTENNEFLLNNNTFLEIKKFRLLSEVMNENYKMILTSTCVTTRTPGEFLNMKNLLVLLNKSDLECQ